MSILLISVLSPTVQALSDAQKGIYNSGVSYFDLDTGGACAASSTDGALTGNDNRQKAFNYFKSKGLSDVQAAGIVGNLVVESSVTPNKNQIGGGPGRGIAQWSVNGRWQNLLKLATKQNTDPNSLATQLDFIWAELNGTPPAGDYKAALADLKKQTTVAGAAASFMNNYEQPASRDPTNRTKAAQKVLSDNGGSTAAVSGAAAACGSAGAVNCTSAADASSGTPTATGGLSQVRQNVVCLAKAELALWSTGKLHTGGSKPYSFFKYTQNADEEWCADFVSWLYNQANYPLKSGNAWRVANIFTIKEIGQAGGKFSYRSAGSNIPKPGDMAIYDYGGGSGHVNLVVSVNTNKGTMSVIGGNQSGTTRANYSSKVSSYDTSYKNTTGLIGFVGPTQ